MKNYKYINMEHCFNFNIRLKSVEFETKTFEINLNNNTLREVA